jgi:tungstate transport system permease protein
VSSELLTMVMNSLYVSTVPTIFSIVFGTPLAVYLHMKGGWISTVIKSVFNGFIGLPTVLLGLLMYILLARSGPLGYLQTLWKAWY